MRNGTTAVVVRNPAKELPHPVAATLADTLLHRLRPGGVWVVPRSVSTVRVLSLDPKVVTAHCIFPDDKLIRLLRSAGWIVQQRQTKD